MPSQKSTKRAVRYEVDEANHLVAIDSENPLHPKRVLKGQFSIQGRNRLVYVISKEGPDVSEGGKQGIALDGAWKLTQNHELALTLHRSQRVGARTLYLKGELLQAEANGLVFALKQNEYESAAAQRLTLSGRWAADSRNRLTFLVEKAGGAEDRLTLQGGWEVGPHHELLYRYRQITRRRGPSEERALIFDGSWDISQSGRLVYRLLGTDTSLFDFRASLESPSIRAASGRIAYQLGIGISQGLARMRHVTLFGSWKINRDLSVSFEIPYSEGRVGTSRFETAVKVNRRDSISVELANERGESLGISVIFARRFSRDVSGYVRLQRSSDESRVMGGVQVRF